MIIFSWFLNVINYNIDQILISPGSKFAIYSAIKAITDLNDEILVPAPSYPLFEFLADLNDVRLAPYPLLYDHGWQMDFDALRGALSRLELSTWGSVASQSGEPCPQQGGPAPRQRPGVKTSKPRARAACA